MMWGNHPFVGGRPFRALLLREFTATRKATARSGSRPREKLPNGIVTIIATRKSRKWPNFAHAGRQGKITDLSKL